MYEERWYWCDIGEIPPDQKDGPKEFDWSRVPPERLELAKAAYRRSLERWMVTTRYQLWGPQIPMYEQWPDLRVVVIGPVE